MNFIGTFHYLMFFSQETQLQPHTIPVQNILTSENNSIFVFGTFPIDFAGCVTEKLTTRYCSHNKEPDTFNVEI